MAEMYWYVERVPGALTSWMLQGWLNGAFVRCHRILEDV